MDLNKFIYELRAELDSTPQEHKLSLIKARLSSIEDIELRSTAETLFEIINYAHDSQLNVVVLIHGIRTHAPWQETLRSLLNKDKKTKTYPIGYGYLDAGRFWFPWYFRDSPIRDVTRKLRAILSKHKNDKITVVAHSYGTHVIATILKNNPDIKLHRLILCGSVISDKFLWDSIKGLPEDKVINDCGNKDKWPVLAKCLSWGYGSTGTFGIKAPPHVYDRHHDLGHSDFFKPEFMSRFWLPFIIGDVIEKSEWENERPTPPWCLEVLDWFPVKSAIGFFLLYYIGTIDWFLLKFSQAMHLLIPLVLQPHSY